MKWVALALLIAIVPILAGWLKSNPKQAPWLWTLLTLLPFVIGPWHLGVAPFATPLWSGYVKGWEVTLLDSIAVAIVIGMPGRWHRLYLLIPLLLYVFACVIALFQAPFGNLAFAYIVQLCRMIIVFMAVARVVQVENGQYSLLRGLVIGLSIQAIYAIIARAGGAVQTGGSLGHQNLLGFVSHMALMPAFAMLLGGRWSALALSGTIAGLLVVTLTISRAAIAFCAIGLALTWLLSLFSGFSGRKAAISFGGGLLLLAAIPLAQSNLDRRFGDGGKAFQGVDLERVAFEKAAESMIADHPLGVGPNHYVFVANTEGYNERAGVFWGTGSRSTAVHNTYLLVHAEIGFPGLIAFVLLIACGIFYAFSTAFRYRRQPGSEMLIGSGCAIVALSLHAFYEWQFVVAPTQYLFGATLGMIAGLRAKYRSGTSTTWKAKPSSIHEKNVQSVTVQTF